MNFIENETSYDTFAAYDRGHEVLYRGVRTQIIWKHQHPQTTFLVLQNGAVLSMKRGEERPVRTFPAFGENTRLTF
jgi:hypothetical protein